MKRVALSIACGAGVVVVLALCLALAAPGRLQGEFAWMLLFPLPYFRELFPYQPAPDDLFHGPSAAALLATLVFDLAFYSLPFYLLLRRRARRVGRLPLPGVGLSVKR